MYIRLTFFFSLFFLLSTYASVYAEESKSEGPRTVHHTPHPPHDHPDNDHIKKLDEGMRSGRKRVIKNSTNLY